MVLCDPLGQKKIYIYNKYIAIISTYTAKTDTYQLKKGKVWTPAKSSPELGFCFGKKPCNGKIYLIQIISAAYRNRGSLSIFSFFLYIPSCISVMSLESQSHWYGHWFWADRVLDEITYCSNLSKNRRRSSIVQGCPHLHVRERDGNYCNLKCSALQCSSPLKSSTCTQPHSIFPKRLFQSKLSSHNMHVLEEGKKLFFHCLHSWAFHIQP